MDKRKTTLVIISIIIVLVASIPFPGLYALWGFLAFAWLVGRIKPDDSSNKTEDTLMRPSDWNLTLDDLIAETKAGKRKHIGHPEIEWARQYEQSLIPAGTRFPMKGDLYESKCDQTIHYMTSWATAYTGGGEAVLLKGERIWISSVNPIDEKPIGTYAEPVEYAKLEKRMVPQEERIHPKYGGFYFFFKTVELNRNFTLIQTGFNGRRRGR